MFLVKLFTKVVFINCTIPPITAPIVSDKFAVISSQFIPSNVSSQELANSSQSKFSSVELAVFNASAIPVLIVLEVFFQSILSMAPLIPSAILLPKLSQLKVFTKL